MNKRSKVVFLMFLVGVFVIFTVSSSLDAQDHMGTPRRIHVKPPQLLPTPQQVAPANNSHFTNFPRNVNLQWNPVKGATTYDVEIDCLNCRTSGKWDSETGQAWKVESNITRPIYSFVFVGDNQGRWRVRAVNGVKNSPWSPWWNFDFKTGPAVSEPKSK